jgi:hypothetical protein
MFRLRLTAFAAAASLALFAARGEGKVLASVGGEVVTEADVVAAADHLPSGRALRGIVEGLVERKIVLALARDKALGASSDEVNRALALAEKAYPPGADVDSASLRKSLADEIVVAKYIDLYVFPRINVGEELLLEYFLKRPSVFIKRPPRDRVALKKLFPRYRNEVLYRYVRAEIERLLQEAGNDARSSLNVEIYIK